VPSGKPQDATSRRVSGSAHPGFSASAAAFEISLEPPRDHLGLHRDIAFELCRQERPRGSDVAVLVRGEPSLQIIRGADIKHRRWRARENIRIRGFTLAKASPACQSCCPPTPRLRGPPPETLRKVACHKETHALQQRNRYSIISSASSRNTRASLCTLNVRRANSELGPSRLHDFDEDAGARLIRVRESARPERSFKSCRSLAFGGQPIPGGIEPSRLFCLDFLPGRHNLTAGYGHATVLQAASDDHRGRGALWLRDDFF
jgi:hypothetical protein